MEFFVFYLGQATSGFILHLFHVSTQLGLYAMANWTIFRLAWLSAELRGQGSENFVEIATQQRGCLPTWARVFR